MDQAHVMLIIGAAITLLVGIWVVATVSSSVVLPTYKANNETVTFADNYTAQALGHSNVMGFTALYYYPNDSFAIPAARYALSGDTILVKANNTGFGAGTDGYPNVTNGTEYYAVYTYQLASSNSSFNQVATSVWNGFNLMAVALIVVAASAIMMYFGFGRMSE